MEESNFFASLKLSKDLVTVIWPNPNPYSLSVFNSAYGDQHFLCFMLIQVSCSDCAGKADLIGAVGHDFSTSQIRTGMYFFALSGREDAAKASNFFWSILQPSVECAWDDSKVRGNMKTRNHLAQQRFNVINIPLTSNNLFP